MSEVGVFIVVVFGVICDMGSVIILGSRLGCKGCFGGWVGIGCCGILMW